MSPSQLNVLGSADVKLIMACAFMEIFLFVYSSLILSCILYRMRFRFYSEENVNCFKELGRLSDRYFFFFFFLLPEHKKGHLSSKHLMVIIQIWSLYMYFTLTLHLRLAVSVQRREKIITLTTSCSVQFCTYHVNIIQTQESKREKVAECSCNFHKLGENKQNQH